MIKSPQQVLVLAMGRAFRDEADGEGSGKETKGRQIPMDDGRTLTFGEKQRMQKDYGTREGNVFARIDLDNGKVIEVLVPAGNLGELAATDGADGAMAKVSLQLMGHGLVQKLGDAAAGAESTEDAMEAILEVATRISKGEFNKNREGGGGSAKGSSELVLAMTEYLQKDNAEITKDTVREMLSALSPAEKNGLRKVPEVAEIIERLKSERKPSAKDAEQAKKAAELLAGLKRGEVPAKTEPAGE